MDEEDMFLEIETQDQSELNSDDMYISLVQAIAVKKCQTVQKKEKLKLALQSSKKLNAELEVSKKESESLKKEREEISNQLNMKALNLKGAEDFRAALETVLCNLRRKVSNLEKETIEKKNRFSSAIQNAAVQWEAYKEIYEEFPLAKKRKKFVIELKKTDIELRKTKFDIEDLKVRRKFKAEIAEKRFKLSCVKLARAFFTRTEKIAEIDSLRKRISELKERAENIQVEHSEEDHFIAANKETSSLPSQAKHKAIKSSFLQLKLPQFPLSPPQLNIENEPSKSGLHSWKTLFSSANLLNISRKNLSIQKETPKIPDKFSEQSTTQARKTLPILYQKTSNIEKTDKIIGNNIFTQAQINDNKQLSEKRKCNSQIEDMNEKQINLPPLKKVRSSNSQLEENDSNKGNTVMKNIGNYDQTTSENLREADKKMARDCNIKIHKNPNIFNSSFNLKSFISKISSSKPFTPLITQTKKPISQELKSISTRKLTTNQQKSFEFHSDTISAKDLSGSVDTQQEKKSTQTSVNPDAVDLFEDEDNENQPDNLTLSMVPTPPDVIPVDNNSQTLPHPDSGTFRSLSSEFISPSELDESAKLHYQRIAAESPGFVYPKGPERVKSQKVGTEESQVVISRYFSDTPQQTTQENQISQEEEEYHTPYSPPVQTDLGSDPDITTNVPSPIPGGLGYFGFGEKNSPEKQLFNQSSSSEGNKSPDAQFGFNFMSNPPKKSSFFSLF